MYKIKTGIYDFKILMLLDKIFDDIFTWRKVFVKDYNPYINQDMINYEDLYLLVDCATPSMIEKLNFRPNFLAFNYDGEGIFYYDPINYHYHLDLNPQMYYRKQDFNEASKAKIVVKKQFVKIANLLTFWLDEGYKILYEYDVKNPNFSKKDRKILQLDDGINVHRISQFKVEDYVNSVEDVKNLISYFNEQDTFDFNTQRIVDPFSEERLRQLIDEFFNLRDKMNHNSLQGMTEEYLIDADKLSNIKMQIKNALIESLTY